MKNSVKLNNITPGGANSRSSDQESRQRTVKAVHPQSQPSSMSKTPGYESVKPLSTPGYKKVSVRKKSMKKVKFKVNDLKEYRDP